DIAMTVRRRVDRKAAIECERVRSATRVLLRRHDVEFAEPLAGLHERRKARGEVAVVIGDEDSHRWIVGSRLRGDALHAACCVSSFVSGRPQRGPSEERLSMHAWLCENPVGVEALTWKELPTPDPKAGEIRVAIRAASLNFPDLLIVQNKYQAKPPLPFVPGSEYAGVVDAVGDGVKHLKVGDPVAAFAGTGGFGTHACVSATLVMLLPKGFAFDDASAFILTYGTTHHALIDRAQLKVGETLLVLGAAGGVGTAAIQIGKVLGARVIAAASSDEKRSEERRVGQEC